MLRGLAQLIFFSEDMAAAKRWYSELLGMEPYFERSGPDGGLAYLEFRIGDYQHEFGIIDRRFAPSGAAGGPGGAIANWQVDDVTAALDKLLAMGATEYEPRIDRGDSGWVTASVVDPFGNVLGITYNPHFVAIRERVGAFEPPEITPDVGSPEPR